MEFKERAIYQLPNGRELVALRDNSEVVLQNLSAAYPGKYELSAEGRLSLDGKITGWSVEDLIETGRFAEPELTGTLEEAHREPRPVYGQELNV